MTDGAIAEATAIRRLGPDDVDLMQAMSDMFAEAFDEAQLHAARRPGPAYLRRLLAGDTFIALAALRGGAVVGGIVAYELPKYEQERSEIYLYDLAVAEPHRRQGIATALIGELRRIAAERGAWVVFVQADYGDDPAVALYTRLGTREDVMHFDLPVEPPRDGGG